MALGLVSKKEDKVVVVVLTIYIYTASSVKRLILVFNWKLLPGVSVILLTPCKLTRLRKSPKADTGGWLEPFLLRISNPGVVWYK